MTYSMPELVALTPATEIIQEIWKGTVLPIEAVGCFSTIPAYEVDE